MNGMGGSGLLSETLTSSLYKRFGRKREVGGSLRNAKQITLLAKNY